MSDSPMQSADDSLLPCPFCGTSPSLENDHHSTPEWTVLCLACDFCLGFVKEKSEAIAMWNRRMPTPDEPKPEADGMAYPASLLGRAAISAYATSCEYIGIEPNWGRGGYKTCRGEWEAIARAVLTAVQEADHDTTAAVVAPSKDRTDAVVMFAAMIEAIKNPPTPSLKG